MIDVYQEIYFETSIALYYVAVSGVTSFYLVVVLRNIIPKNVIIKRKPQKNFL
jgi:hypothetical protein